MTDFFGFQIFSGNLSERLAGALNGSSALVINTINAHSFNVTKTDYEFDLALRKCDVLLPDGIGIVLASRLVSGHKLKKIAGYDLFECLMSELEQRRGSCLFFGSTPITLAKIMERARGEYPNVKVKCYSPPFVDEFTSEENQRNLTEIGKVDVLFVAMTAPKQEKWVYENVEVIDAKIVCSIGAVFDFYARTVPRPNRFFIDLGLEWLGRIISEPKRFGLRYAKAIPLFIFNIMVALTRDGKNLDNR
jgi:N-acetylglucosaminyldiphosphoundecaprenol N-acetyl-beta-D-mannosaminyltransferase